MLPVLRVVLSLALVVAPVLAQNTQIPGSGCAGAPFTSAPDARVGQALSWSCPICLGTATHLTVIGVPLPALLPLQPPATCASSGTCFLACDPILVIQGASSRLPIPADPRLVGACLCAQCACYDLNFACLSVMGALQICIQP